MSIPSSDCDTRLVVFDFEDEMFVSLFKDSGIEWLGVFSYRHMMKTSTSFFG